MTTTELDKAAETWSVGAIEELKSLRDSNENLDRENARLRSQVATWEAELSKVMPPDFKDWWQNSKSEWPIVARLVIESLRSREQQAWDILSNAPHQARSEAELAG